MTVAAGAELSAMLRAAARGEFPAPDGNWSRVRPWRAGVEGVIAFTGHAVFALGADVSDARLVELGADGLGGAHDPRLIAALAGAGGWIDSLDVLLVAFGTGRADPGDLAIGQALVERPDLAEHPRTRFARFLRDEVRVLGFPDPASRAIAVLGLGLGTLTELSFELDPPDRGSGLGRALLRAALAAVPTGEPVLAACAPGNAASLRSLLAAGFAPIGSVQLFTRGAGPPAPTWEDDAEAARPPQDAAPAGAAPDPEGR